MKTDMGLLLIVFVSVNCASQLKQNHNWTDIERFVENYQMPWQGEKLMPEPTITRILAKRGLDNYENVRRYPSVVFTFRNCPLRLVVPRARLTTLLLLDVDAVPFILNKLDALKPIVQAYYSSAPKESIAKSSCKEPADEFFMYFAHLAAILSWQVDDVWSPLMKKDDKASTLKNQLFALDRLERKLKRLCSRFDGPDAKITALLKGLDKIDFTEDLDTGHILPSSQQAIDIFNKFVELGDNVLPFLWERTLNSKSKRVKLAAFIILLDLLEMKPVCEYSRYWHVSESVKDNAQWLLFEKEVKRFQRLLSLLRQHWKRLRQD